MKGGRRLTGEADRHSPHGGGFAGLLLVGLHLALGLLLFDPTLFPGGDNAGYMILGDSLASGQGYRDLYLPHAPLHTKYPPLYPVLLAALSALGGLQLFKLVSLLITSLAVWITYRLAERLAGRRGGLLAAGLLAISPVLLEYSHYVLSEALFVTLVAASLLLLDRCAEQAGGSRGHVLLTGLAAGLAAAALAFLTRTAGIPLLAAVILFFGIERRWRPFGAAIAVGGGAAGGWWLYQRIASARYPSASGDSAPGYLAEMLLRNPYDPGAGSAGPVELLLRAAGNAWTYLTVVLPQSLFGAPGTGLSGEPLLIGIGLLLAALAFVGWAHRSMVRLGPAELFTPLYAVMLALWPSVWTDQRFLLPLLPLLLAYAMRGADVLGRRVAGPAGAGLASAMPAFVIAAALGLGAGYSVVSKTPERIRCMARYRAGDPCDPADFASFYAAARWASENTPSDAVIVSRKPRIFFWLSGRRGDLYRYSANPDEVLKGLELLGTDYVVVDAISTTTDLYLLPAIRENLSRFRAVYDEGTPPTLVLRFEPEPVTAD